MRPGPCAAILTASPRSVSQVASTVPADGDVNPYGIVVVLTSADRLTAGDILVSNFNDRANAQGPRTTIVQVSPATAPPAGAHSSTVVGSGYPWRANKAALILAPTVLALGRNGTLYVADTLTNTISAIPRALNRTTVPVELAGHGPG